jgi:RimJ/RimL family protein N-acetyltransferase
MRTRGRDRSLGVLGRVARVILPNVFPAVELTTARLVLRAHIAADVEPTVALFDDDLAREWLSAPQPYTREESRRWCTETAHALRTIGDGINWAITDRETGEFFGGIGLKSTSWLRRCTEVGYAVGPWARGHGYAPEATRAVAQWALRERRFHRVELLAAVGNTGSQRTAEKAGFVREGVARNGGYTHRGQVDMVVFSMIPSDLEG